MTDFFGEGIGPDDVINWVIAHGKRWLPTYLAGVAAQKGIDYNNVVKPPSVWHTKTRFENILANDLPLLAVQCPGLNGQRPERHGDGRIDAWFVVAVGAVLPGRDDDSAREMSQLYGIAIRKLMIQKPDLGDNADAVVWEDERYDDLRRPGLDEARHSTRQVFSVLVAGVDDWRLGPPEPAPDDNPTQPSPGWPVVREGGARATINRGG